VAPYFRFTFERHRRRMTQAETGKAAKDIGGLHRVLTQHEISLIELGRLNPTANELNALARVFDVHPPEALLRPVVAVAEEAVAQ
jgi:transcriptional regulator with XRE-family HTH domain